MAYDVFKNIVSKEKYFSTWEPQKINLLTKKLMQGIYDKYVAKCKVFQRDNYTCQNRSVNKEGEIIPCECCRNIKYASNLTAHHVKFQKNGGRHTERNQVTVCAGAHKSYHRAKNPLVFSEESVLPTHIRGHTFQLEKPDTINWKKVKAECKILRKRLKLDSNIELHKIDLETIAILLRWLDCDYDDCE